MNSKWRALLLISLASGWACSREPDSQPLPATKFKSDDGGMAGMDAATALSGESGATGLGGSMHVNGGTGATAGRAITGAGAGSETVEAGLATAGEGGDTFGQGGNASWEGEAGSGGQPDEAPVGPHCKSCSVTQLKTPVWRFASAVLSVAPIGSAALGNESYFEWLAKLFSPQHQLVDYIYGPGLSHPPPYDDELFQLLTVAGGTPQQSFTAAEFGAPNGIALMLTMAPNANAPVGSSVDFDSGPIIPNQLFPLFIDGNLYRNGVLYDGEFDNFYPGYNSLSTPIEKDGPSHSILLFAENSSYVPNIESAGSYVFRISVVDASEAGWVLDVPFTVQ
jgi:hypothetical protein